MKYLHSMVRVTDVDASLRFYVDALGLEVIRRNDYPQGKYSLIFLAAPGDSTAQIELTHNWVPERYGGGRNFGTSRTRSTTSTPPASGCRSTA
jgi:lactoylglutathione lyase